MATFIDAALLGHFSSLFVFLFVLVVSYAVLTMTGILGENKSLGAIIALVLAVLFAASSTAVRIFELAAPWYVLIFIILFLLILLFKFTGTEEVLAIKKGPTTIIIIIIIIITIFILAAGQVNKEKKEKLVEEGKIASENEILSFPGKIGEIMRTPAILGLVIVLLIAVFAIMLLSASSHK